MKVWLVLLVLFVTSATYSRAQEEDEVEEDGVIDEEAEDFEELSPEQDDLLPEAPVEELKLPEERPEYRRPEAKGNTFFTETFDDADSIGSRWILSEARKDDADENIAKYDGVWKVEEPEVNPLQGDQGLVLKSRARHHAIAAKLDTPYEFNGKPFVVQYEVKFQNGQDCGGAYIKLLTQTPKLDLGQFGDKTGYTVMFGPDKCGTDDKLHFIFRHKNPSTGMFEEKHAKKPTKSKATTFTDKKTHLYTLVVMPDNSFEVYVDQDMVNSGNLLEDVTPAVNPEKEIVDPNEKKPETWDDKEKIADPDAVKPEEWDEDEPEMIVDESAVKPEGWLDDEEELTADPNAEKPTDWDDDMDGEWEPPMITNPLCETAPGCGEWVAPKVKNTKYQGIWKAPMIDNPNYQGKWKPSKIPNPDYFEDLEPYKMTTIDAVGLELWSMSDNIYFDNFIITDSKETADQWAADTFELKRTQEMLTGSSGKSVVDAVMDATHERPWLWAVFIFVVVLPIILIIAYCCMSGSSSTPPPRRTKLDDIANAKKTDEASPDDPQTEEKEAAEEETTKEETAEKKEEEASTPEKKEEKGAGDTKPKKGRPTKKSKSDLEAEDEAGEGDAEEDADEAPLTPSRSSPRKRTKARKE